MMNSKMMAAGGAAKKGTHKMPDGTTMKNSDMKSMKTGGMAMTMKDGKKVPAFAQMAKARWPPVVWLRRAMRLVVLLSQKCVALV